MAGWISDSESDEEPLNLNLFNRKCFGFMGIPDDTVSTFKNIVKQLGGSCDRHPKYVFSTREYYNSLDEKDSNLYNITFIRDCIDANRYLNVEQYKFGVKDEKRDFRDFEPCCSNFHKSEQGCAICNPAYKKDLSTKQRRKSKIPTNPTADVKQDVTVQKSNARNYWEPWECRLLLDYIICNNLFFWVKSASMYRRIFAEGFLTHRSPNSMRLYFCKQILPHIDQFDLPKPIKRKFNQKAMYPSRHAKNKITVNRQNGVIIKRQMGKNRLNKPNIDDKPCV